MNYKKIIATAAAVCMTASCAVVNCRVSGNITGGVHAEEQSQDNAVTLNYVGDSVPITFTGSVKITWYSDDDSIATVTPTSDLSAEITATGKGSTAVYAVLPDRLIRFGVTVLHEKSEVTSTVDVGSVTLTNQQKSAEVKLTGIEASDAVWTSSDTSVATVDEKGVITAVGKGTCVVQAQYGNTGYIINVTSEYEEKEEPGKEPQLLGTVELSDKIKSQQITGITPEVPVTLSSTDETVATVSASGLITAVGSGSCRIYIESNGTTGYFEVVSTYTGNSQANTDLGSVTLDSETPSRKISISGIPDGTAVSWSSSDSSIAIVTKRGSIIAVSDGECVASAKVGDVEYTAAVKVENAGKIPSTEIKGVGQKLAFSPGDIGENTEFFSTDESILTVDGSGTITTVGTGTASVIAESDTGLSFMRFTVVPSCFYGDANCDDVVDIADATIILQSIGNGDKYALTEQGQLNADVDGNPGVTARDSLVVQMFDAKLISALPADSSALG
ncbi:MAG: dockerin type I repeat-containing protein [Ruminococcus sp.]|nr:dockerin type I repeat-containing protein [Ruminococcus sp.]